MREFDLMTTTNEFQDGNDTLAADQDQGPSFISDEIDLARIVSLIWSRKWRILKVSVAAGIVFAAVGFLIPNKYTAEVILEPVEAENSAQGLQSLAAQYGGIADLIGVDLGGNTSVESNIAILRARFFTSRFFADKSLLPVLFANRWDAEKKAWKTGFLRSEPSLWDAYERWDEDIRSVRLDPKTGLLTLRIEWTDPKQAAEWANDLVSRVNSHLRDKATRDAEKSIQYLKEQIAITKIADMKEVLYRLLERQLQTIVLANVSEEFAFKIIDPAVAPEKHSSPKRLALAIMGVLLGAIISMLWFLLTNKDSYRVRPEGSGRSE